MLKFSRLARSCSKSYTVSSERLLHSLAAFTSLWWSILYPGIVRKSSRYPTLKLVLLAVMATCSRFALSRCSKTNPT